MSNCSTFKILIDRFAGQRLSVTVELQLGAGVRKPVHRKRATIAASFEQRPANGTLSF
jgi:hypothetical protein